VTAKGILAAVAGGAVMFVWGAVSHMVLPLGMAGIGELPAEDQVLAALREHVPDAGFYFFPGMGEGAGGSREEREAAWKRFEEKHRRGPHGILVYAPGGGEPMSTRQLATELASNVAACLVASVILAQLGAGASYGRRALVAALVGLAAVLGIEASYWNWYGFPTAYFLAAVVDQVAGFGLAGLAMAAMVKSRAA
jgi:hypothetical protein